MVHHDRKEVILMNKKNKQKIIDEAIAWFWDGVVAFTPIAGNVGIDWQPNDGEGASYRVESADTVRWLLREFTPRFDDLDYIASRGYDVLDSDESSVRLQLMCYYATALEEAGSWHRVALAPRG